MVKPILTPLRLVGQGQILREKERGEIMIKYVVADSKKDTKEVREVKARLEVQEDGQLNLQVQDVDEFWHAVFALKTNGRGFLWRLSDNDLGLELDIDQRIMLEKWF